MRFQGEQLYVCAGCGYILAVITVEGPEFKGELDCPNCSGMLTSSALTRRQIEVLKELVSGRTVREIADLLNISIKTVEEHRAHIYSRLKIHDIPNLVKYAIKNGLTSL
jgi:DNA-binding NarL/FixJ family response regulator